MTYGISNKKISYYNVTNVGHRKLQFMLTYILSNRIVSYARRICVIYSYEIFLIEILASFSFNSNIKHSGNRSSDLFSLWNLSMYFINDLVNFLLQRNNSCATVACWHMGRKLWTHILQSDKVCKRKRTNDFVFLPFDIKELSKWKEKIQIPYFIL